MSIIKSELKRTGELIGPVDMLLAGQAIANKLVLVSNNTREFARIKQLEVNNWAG